MMFKTHLVFGFLISLFVLSYITVESKYIFILMICLGAVFVDIDDIYSKVGRKLPVISWIFNLIFGHRGFFHTITAALIIFGVFYFFNLKLLGFGFFIGYLSHLLIDGLNVMGVKMFKPFSGFHIKGFIKTGGFLEYLLFFILVFLVLTKIKILF